MSFHNARSKTIASNIANVDTPGFVPKDIAGGRVQDALKAQAGGSSVSLAQTNARHLTGASQTTRIGGFAPTNAPDSETTLDGNAVVLEEQMTKLGESRMAHDAAIGLYQKSLAMIRSAVRAPGR